MSAIWASLQSDGLNLFTPTTTEVCGGTVQLWRSPKPSEKHFVNSSESGREREEDRFLENNVHIFSDLPICLWFANLVIRNRALAPVC